MQSVADCSLENTSTGFLRAEDWNWLKHVLPCPTSSIGTWLQIRLKRPPKKALQEIATANKVSMAALATAWIIAYEDISCALSGFTKLAYVDDNLSALTLVEKWNVDLEKQIEAVLLNAPEQDGDPKTWAPRITRRPH